MTYESPYAGFNGRQMTLTEAERECTNRVWGAGQIISTTIQVTFGATAPFTAGGTLTFVANANGHWMNMASAATTGQLAGRVLASIGSFQTLPTSSAIIETGSDLTSQRLWVGIGYTNSGAGSIANGTDNASTTGDFIGFRYSTAAPDTSWTQVTACAATPSQTTAATGVAVTASTRYDFLFCYANSTTVYGYIGTGADQPLAGPFVFTVPSAVVTTTISYGIQAVLENTANAARALRWSRFWFSRR